MCDNDIDEKWQDGYDDGYEQGKKDAQARSLNPALDHLRMSVPEYYGDAKKRWPWIECEPHEWDNRTGLENVEYILIESAQKLIVYLEFEADKKAFEEWFEKHGQHMNMASKINMRAGWLARGRPSAHTASKEGKDNGLQRDVPE